MQLICAGAANTAVSPTLHGWHVLLLCCCAVRRALRPSSLQLLPVQLPPHPEHHCPGCPFVGSCDLSQSSSPQCCCNQVRLVLGGFFCPVHIALANFPSLSLCSQALEHIASRQFASLDSVLLAPGLCAKTKTGSGLIVCDPDLFLPSPCLPLCLRVFWLPSWALGRSDLSPKPFVFPQRYCEVGLCLVLLVFGDGLREEMLKW